MVAELSSQQISPASPLKQVSRYDALRVATYRDRECLFDSSSIRPLGSAVALRFDQVGYFNRVYCADQSIYSRLPEVESFYRAGFYGCELVGPPEGNRGGAAIERPGWQPCTRYAWLAAADCAALRPIAAGAFDIRPVETAQRELYVRTYLAAFEAEPQRIPNALRNMRHLFEVPDLHFLLAWRDGKAVGVGSLMTSGDDALLCAGAALPEFREMGCHTALLNARVRLARDLGCTALHSWAVEGGQSHLNMQKIGLETLGVTQTWRLLPNHRP